MHGLTLTSAHPISASLRHVNSTSYHLYKSKLSPLRWRNLCSFGLHTSPDLQQGHSSRDVDGTSQDCTLRVSKSLES